ncbi:MAG: GIY-YIG nuclease family protein [Cetobacterium sp.]
MIIIYKITNIVNNKVYIGQTVNYTERIRHHKQVPFRENSIEKDRPLYKSMRKYGVDKFKFEIIDECFDFEVANKKEIEYIKEHNCCIDNGYGYNLDLGGKNGMKSEETKKKISEAHQGYGGGSYGKRKGEAHRARKIMCLENEVVYDSIIECAEDLFGGDYLSSDRIKISTCANPNSNRFTHKGYSFRYVDEDGEIIEKNTKPLSLAKYNRGMGILDCKTNIEYKSITDVSRAIGISTSMIRDRIYGRVECEKYKFKIINNEEQLANGGI